MKKRELSLLLCVVLVLSLTFCPSVVSIAVSEDMIQIDEKNYTIHHTWVKVRASVDDNELSGKTINFCAYDSMENQIGKLSVQIKKADDEYTITFQKALDIGETVEVKAEYDGQTVSNTQMFTVEECKGGYRSYLSYAHFGPNGAEGYEKYFEENKEKGTAEITVSGKTYTAEIETDGYYRTLFSETYIEGLEVELRIYCEKGCLIYDLSDKGYKINGLYNNVGTPKPTPRPTSTPYVPPTIRPTPTLAPTVTPTVTQVPIPTSTPEYTPTPTGTPIAWMTFSPSPLPTYTPRPTSKPENRHTRSNVVTKIKLPKKKTVTVGFSYKFEPKKVLHYQKMKGLKWKSSNKRIATVNSKGKVKGKQIGNCTIICRLKNGKKYNIRLDVKANVRNNIPRFTDRYGDCDIDYTRFYFNGSSLVMNARVSLWRMFRATKYDWIRITVHTGNKIGGKSVLASYTFRNVPLNIPAYSRKNITLTFPSSSVRSKHYDLRADDDIYISYRYVYTYVY